MCVYTHTKLERERERDRSLYFLLMFFYQKNLKEGCGVVLDEILMVARDIRCFQWGIRMLKIQNFKSTLSQTSLGNIYHIWFQRNTKTLFVAELVSFVLGVGCLCLVHCGCWVWRSCILVHVSTKIFHSYKRKKRKRKIK